MKRLMMAIWISISILLATTCAGCVTNPIVIEDAHCDGGDAAQDVVDDHATLATDQPTITPAIVDANVPTMVDATQNTHDAATTVAVDAAVSVTDAGSTMDAASPTDASTSRFLEARVLAPTTCHGRTLRLPDAFYARGVTAWHLCYVTEDPHAHPDGGVTPPRPASVTFELGHDGSFDLDPIVDAPAPRTANPWTTSVAIAIPDDITNPRFNVMDVLDGEGAAFLWALDVDGLGGLRTRGTLRAWRVGPDGQQTEVPLQPLFAACDGMIGPSEFPPCGYVPQGLCPAALAGCAPGPYHCRH